MLQNSDNLFSHLTEYVAGETAFRLQVQSKELLSVGEKRAWHARAVLNIIYSTFSLGNLLKKQASYWW